MLTEKGLPWGWVVTKTQGFDNDEAASYGGGIWEYRLHLWYWVPARSTRFLKRIKPGHWSLYRTIVQRNPFTKAEKRAAKKSWYQEIVLIHADEARLAKVD